MYSHAYSGWWDRLQHVKQVWKGEADAWKHIREYNISYLFKEWHMEANMEFLGSCCNEVYRSPSGRFTIYKVTSDQARADHHPPS